MKRLFTEFNDNIRKELKQTENVKGNARKIADSTQQMNVNYENYRRTSYQQRAISNRITRYAKTDPAFTESLKEQKETIKKEKENYAILYNSYKTDVARLKGNDYPIDIRVFIYDKSDKEEYRKPLRINKSKLLANKDPALFILKEHKKRIKYELTKGEKQIKKLTNKLFDLTIQETAQLLKLQKGQNGLNVLHQKTIANILMLTNGKDYEKTVSENPKLLANLIKSDRSEMLGSANIPLFYFPQATLIDIL